MEEPFPDVEALVAWLRGRPGGNVEDGLSPAELNRAEDHFGLRFPPLWRVVLTRVHPIAVARPGRGQDALRRWAAYPDWRLREEAATSDLIASPIDGLLFDVEHNDFWWTGWGVKPADVSERVGRAAERLATVPRLVPLWSHLYIAPSDDSPVFSIVQADLFIPALTVLDLPTGRGQDVVPRDDWPIGNVTFWSELHAYSQLGTQ